MPEASPDHLTPEAAPPAGDPPEPPRTGRRALTVGALAALGLGAVGVAQAFIPRPGQASPGVPNTSGGVTSTTGSSSVGTKPTPSGTPSPTPTATPTPTPAPPPEQDAPGVGGQGGPTGPGAPDRPSDLAPSPDRDSSYASEGAAQHPSMTGRDPQLPAGRTYGSMDLPVADTPEARRHLLTRAGLAVGSAAEEQVAAMGLDAWLGQQLDPEMPDSATDAIRSWYPLAYADIPTTRSSIEKYAWDAMMDVTPAVLARSMFSERQIFEQVVDVMANMLHVTTPAGMVWDNAGDYHMSVIRAHAFGNFRDMLLASGRHPAMLRYLDNVASVRGEVNENYGRELLELHTVGVDGGYTEADVLASAKILSGRRVDGDTGAFSYQPKHHVVGPVAVLDFTAENADADAGLELGDDYLRYLATHPSTARSIARKFAVRFIADTPPDAIVDRLAQVYLDNDTSLLAVLVELFRSEEFWTTTEAKIRRPLEDVVGSVRAMGITPETASRDAIKALYWMLNRMGHAPLGWGPPNGYPDVAAAWMSASQMIARWNFHTALVNGWYDDLEPAPELLTAFTPQGGTPVDEWIDTVSTLILGVPANESQRDAAYAFLGVASGDVTSSDSLWLMPYFVAMLLNSPTFAIR